MSTASEIQPASGKLGVLLPGLGAVATTFIAGVFACRKGLAKPVGSLTQMGTIRLGKRTEDRVPSIKDFVPLRPARRFPQATVWQTSFPIQAAGGRAH